jgi:V-type H+-transporting ATPase subunit C
MYQELIPKLGLAKTDISPFAVPQLKTGTLELLISLSEELPKHDTFFTAAVAKIVETLRNLLNDDPNRLAQHTLVEERSVDDYLFKSWSWDAGRYGTQRGLREILDTLSRQMTSIDNSMKAKLNSYNLAKGQLQQMQRKKTGNLSVKSLAEIVSEKNFVQDSEYLETLLVAVGKNSIKDWNQKYERLAPMVVPRSANKIAEDDEYALFSVVVFKKSRDAFAQKCRENKYILRDFAYDAEKISQQQNEFEIAGTSEKELWTELLRLSRTNFSEAFQLLVHLKVLRLFVESVLRYGLPANYVGLVIKPDSKTAKKTLATLNSYFSFLAPKSKQAGRGKIGADEVAGEFQSILEQEFFDFVLFEVPWVVT